MSKSQYTTIKNLQKYQIFKLIIAIFIIGVFISSYSKLEIFHIYLSLLTLLLLITFFHKNKGLKIFLLFIFSLTLGIFRYQVSLPINYSDKIWYYNNQQIVFNGVVSEFSDIRINHTKIIVSAKKLNDKSISGKVLVSTFLYPQYNYGDLLEINCYLKSPENFNGFAYDRYLAKDGIYSICSRPYIKKLENQKIFFFSNIFILKLKVREIINKNLPEPHASILAAVLLGERKTIPTALTQKFSQTGTTHLMAISGLHITLIISVLMQIFLGLYISRKKSFWLITIILLIYLSFLGFPPSAVRAFIIGWLVMLSLYLGRINNFSNSLMLAAGVMILINPKILRDDIGFQLSFCAVLGISLFLPLLQKILKKIPKSFGIQDSLAVSLSASATTLPLIVYNFGIIPVVSPLANLFILPILPFIMIFGFLAIVFSFISPILFYFVWFLIQIMIWLVNFFAAIPSSFIKI